MSTRVLTTDDFEIEEDVIGEGAYSVVKLGRLRPLVVVHGGEVGDADDPLTDQRDLTFAIKQLSKAHVVKEKKTHTVKREKEALVSLRDCDHIVRLYHTFQDHQYLYFAMEYCSGGDLQAVVNKLGALDIECVKYYMAQLGIAVRQLRQHGIVHRDIKPENLLLDSTHRLKLADFGSCIRFVAEPVLKARSSSFVGTAEYVPPELLTKKNMGFGADVWGMGCCLYFLTCGRTAFSAGSEWLVFERIQEFDVVIPQNMDAHTKNLLKLLLCYDEQNRLGVDDVEMRAFFEHPFFEGVEWETVSTRDPPEIRCSPVSLSFPEPESISAPNSPVVGTPPVGGSQLSSSAPLPGSPAADRERVLEQQRGSIWSQYLIPGSETITFQGTLVKRASLIPRRRMFLLTDLPRLIYVDPDTMVQKGEVPLSQDVSVEIRNEEHFFLHVPGRTYVLQCPKKKSAAWKAAVEGAILLLKEKARVRSSQGV